MAYLAIMVLVAAAGIFRLWLLQRKERAALSSIDTFWASLQRMGTQLDPRQAQIDRKAPRGRRVTLDADRRRAAKRRIQARRRAATSQAARRRRQTGRRGPAPRTVQAARARQQVAARRRTASAPRAASRVGATGGAQARRGRPRPAPKVTGRSAPPALRRIPVPNAQVEWAEPVAAARSGAVRSAPHAEARRTAVRRDLYTPPTPVRLEAKRVPRAVDLRDRSPGHVLVRRPEDASVRPRLKETAAR